LDARGLSDNEMQALARETRLEENDFRLSSRIPPSKANPRKGPNFHARGGTTFCWSPHPGYSSGTAHRLVGDRTTESAVQVVLDLKVGKVPVEFKTDASGRCLEKCGRCSRYSAKFTSARRSPRYWASVPLKSAMRGRSRRYRQVFHSQSCH
jgi:predicted PhzF superfamily epimerase YddE/YHI9